MSPSLKLALPEIVYWKRLGEEAPTAESKQTILGKCDGVGWSILGRENRIAVY